MNPIFDLSVYARRRAALLDGLDDAVIVIAAAPEHIRSNDVHHTYRPSNDMLYLTGFAEPDSLAVLRTGGAGPAFALFVRAKDPKRERWEGARVGVEDAKALYGADETYSIEHLDEKLPELLSGHARLHYRLNSRPDLDAHVFAALDSLRGSRAKPNKAPGTIVDPRSRLHDLRRVKDPDELELMRMAARIAAEVHVDAMRRLRPGMMEYEVEALLNYGYRQRGAFGVGYDTIVGGGANATVLHYTANDQPLVEGTLVLVDSGAEYGYYNSDITRTFPVGRRFTPAQRDLYEAVLEVQVEAVQRVVPGESAHGLTEWSRRRLTEQLVELGLLSGSVDELVEEKAYERFYMHGLGHYLGLDVHDVGTYLVDDDVALPFEPGVVMTIEPGLYIPDDAEDVPEEMRGVGIRIEDDVVVTSDAPEVLTDGVPKTVEEIESLRQQW